MSSLSSLLLSVTLPSFLLFHPLPLINSTSPLHLCHHFLPPLLLLYFLFSLVTPVLASLVFLPSFYLLSLSFLHPYLHPNSPSHSPYLTCILYPSLRFSPRPDWWCVEARQTDGGWGIAPASLWHWAPFRPGKWSMLNLILNTPSLTPADRRRVEASVWQHSWGNLIRPTVQVYLQVCLCALGVFMCVAVLLETARHRSHLSYT